MPVSIIDHGTDNTVEIDPDHLANGEGTIELSGSGNAVIIEKPMVYGRLSISVAGGARVFFGAGCSIADVYVDSPRGAAISVGAGTWFNGGSAFRMDEECGITVGRGCLFGDEVRIWTSDMHSVVDMRCRRVNTPREVVIGNRVWIGFRSLVLKGSRIGDGSVLGAGAVLAGSIPDNCVAAGNPAKVVKRRVTWDAQLPDHITRR